MVEFHKATKTIAEICGIIMAVAITIGVVAIVFICIAAAFNNLLGMV